MCYIFLSSSGGSQFLGKIVPLRVLPYWPTRLEVARIALEVGSEPFPGFCLKELRGRGGFAEVWEASSPAGERVALKFFTSDRTTSTIKEVKSLTAIQKLHHPYIIHMEHVWSVPGYIVVAMELAEGSLLELLDAYQAEYRTPIEKEMLCRSLTQAADAIDFLNARQHFYEGRRVGWQHCDIKPSNLLLSDNVVKLADFGLASPTTALLNPYPSGGTLDFAAPEIHRGMLSERSDQYSLAVTYYYLRTNSFPFPAPTDGFRRKHSYTRPAADLSLIPRSERKVLERSLAIQPEERWENCSEMMRAMHEAIVNGGSSAISSVCMQAVSTDAS